MKKVEKKLKSVREKEAKFSTENMRIERIGNQNHELIKTVETKLDDDDKAFSHKCIQTEEPEPVTNLDSQPQMKLSNLKSCPVPTSSLDPPCSLETISNMNPINSNMATTTSPTSKNSNIETSEDHLSASEELELMNMLKKFSVKVDAMSLMLKDTSEELKQK